MLIDDLGQYGATQHAVEQARISIAPAFWRWYAQHTEDKIATINFLFFSKTVRVKDARPVFVVIFGQPTVSA